MSRKSAPSTRGEFAILYWMGGALVLLIAGALLLTRTGPRPVPDPERTLVWIHDPADAAIRPVALILEESRQGGLLTLVGIPAPPVAQAAFAQGPRKTRDAVESWLGRRLHHHVVLPLPVVVTLVDAAGGIAVESRTLDGTAASAHLRAAADTAAPAVSVLKGLVDAVNQRGVRMGASEGFSLARQVDTDLDLMSLPTILTRWSQYPQQRLEAPSAADAEPVRKLLLPDPAA